jgi:hypothetical protein
VSPTPAAVPTLISMVMLSECPLVIVSLVHWFTFYHLNVMDRANNFRLFRPNLTRLVRDAVERDAEEIAECLFIT